MGVGAGIKPGPTTGFRFRSWWSSATLARAVGIGGQYGVSYHADYRALLADGTMEAISIATFDSLCRDACVAAAKAGEHILLRCHWPPPCWAWRTEAATGEDGLAITKAMWAMERPAETGRPEDL